MKRALYAIGAVLVLAALVVLLAPAYIDTPAVRAEIQRRLAQAVDGEIAWEALEIGFFPAPHGELRRVRIDMPGRMSAAAERVQAYLRLWPLLRGRVEIASFSVSRPEIRIQGSGKSEEQELDAVAAYRKALEPAVQALQRFAPDTELRIERAAIDPGGLRDLNVNVRTAADGVDLKLGAASAFWKRLAVDAHVTYSDLSARGRVELDALVLDKDLPPATVRAVLRTDAKSAVEGDFDASLGSIATAKGKLVLPAGKPPRARGARGRCRSRAGAGARPAQGTGARRHRVRQWEALGGCQREPRAVVAGADRYHEIGRRRKAGAAAVEALRARRARHGHAAAGAGRRRARARGRFGVRKRRCPDRSRKRAAPLGGVRAGGGQARAVVSLAAVAAAAKGSGRALGNG